MINRYPSGPFPGLISCAKECFAILTGEWKSYRRVSREFPTAKLRFFFHTAKPAAINFAKVSGNE